MKNKHRIEKLEKQVAVLTNLVHILQMKANPLVPAAAPAEWASWKPFWMEGPNPLSTSTNKTGYQSNTPAYFH